MWSMWSLLLELVRKVRTRGRRTTLNSTRSIRMGGSSITGQQRRSRQLAETSTNSVAKDLGWVVLSVFTSVVSTEGSDETSVFPTSGISSILRAGVAALVCVWAGSTFGDEAEDDGSFGVDAVVADGVEAPDS